MVTPPISVSGTSTGLGQCSVWRKVLPGANRGSGAAGEDRQKPIGEQRIESYLLQHAEHSVSGEVSRRKMSERRQKWLAQNNSDGD